ncbi:MAG: electron transfer flavoprotein subunit alpha/FixB family protein [Elusimicrobiota bacterium]
MKNSAAVYFLNSNSSKEHFFSLAKESLNLAHKYEGKSYALIFSDREDIPSDFINLGFEKIYFCRDERIFDDNFSAAVCAEFIKKNTLSFVIFQSDDFPKTVSARFAAKINSGLIADACEIYFNNGEPVFLKPAMGGNIKAEIFSKSELKIISFKTYPLSQILKTQKISETEELTIPSDIKALTRLISQKQIADNQRNISDSKIVIGIGRRVKKEDLPLIKEFADLISASMGYTRPAVHEGLGPHENQIGVSGKTISPDIYINLAVSGKSYHMSGIKGNPIIISVNTDEKAQVFEYSDYFVKSDYKTFVTEILKELKK